MKYLFFFLLIALSLTACEFLPEKKEQNFGCGTSNLPLPLPPKIPITDTLALKGEALFLTHCTACHQVDRKLVGPALKGISQKYAGDEKWLYAFIRNSQKMIKKGDAKAVALYKESGEATMNSFTFLTDEDIKAILLYIDVYYRN